MINLVFDKNALPPSELSLEEVDSCFGGVIIASRYNLKKDREFFSDYTYEAVVDGLSDIDSLETYESQRIEDMSYKDKTGHLNHYY